jgi:hypothetical protein
MILFEVIILNYRSIEKYVCTRKSNKKGYFVVIVAFSLLKETVSRDFRPLVFFINQLHLGP